MTSFLYAMSVFQRLRCFKIGNISETPTKSSKGLTWRLLFHFYWRRDENSIKKQELYI